MGTEKLSTQLLLLFFVLLLADVHPAVHEYTHTDPQKTSPYQRQARDDRYYLNRYGSSGSGSGVDRDRDRRVGYKLRDPGHPEARGERGDRDSDQQHATGAPQGVEKRCIRCTTSYLDPYEYRDYYERDRYNNDRNYYDRYDRYDDRYDRSSYYDRDRWYDRRPYYDDRYDYRTYDRGYDRGYDRYDRGFGYDNRGYDNRGFDYRRTYENRNNRPWESSSYEYSRGYPNRPDYWGYDKNYASGYYYGRDNWRDPYRREQYGYDGYRGTSYLYERQPSPATTVPPPDKPGEVGPTERPGDDAKPLGDSATSG